MKKTLGILFVAFFFQFCPAHSFAGNWNSWQSEQGMGNQPDQKEHPRHYSPNAREGEQKITREERYCSSEEEEELLQLLDKLKQLTQNREKQTGRWSTVQQKYRIAKKLGKFDDCRAEDALQELLKENACEDLGEGEILCVARGANSSLQKIQSQKDLKKLLPETPLAEQLPVIKKYGLHPHKNEIASHAVRDFLITQSPSDPDLYVPLLLEYFVHSPEVIPVARQFPQAANVGLQRCFFASHSSTVWHGIQLARTLEKSELIGSVFSVAFENKGNIDYSQQKNVETIQTAALSFLKMFESQSISYYRKILFGDFPKIQEYLISGIRDLNNQNLLNLLKEFEVHLLRQPGFSPSLFVVRLQKKISLMEEAQK